MSPGRLHLLAALFAIVCPRAADAAEAHRLSRSESHHSPVGPQNRTSAFSVPPPGAGLVSFLQKTHDDALALGLHVVEIHETYFPAEAREQGMEQEAFVEAAGGLMAALAQDQLYTAGVSKLPDAPFPRFDWPWSRCYRMSSEYYYHIGWHRYNTTDWQQLLERRMQLPGANAARNNDTLEVLNTWGGLRPRLLGAWADDVPPDCVEGQPNHLWSVDYQAQPYVNDPDGITIHLCRGQPPQGASDPGLAETNFRVTVCIHQVLRVDPRHRLRPEWLETFFQHYSALGAEHFFVYSSHVPFVDVPGFSYDWLDVSWMHSFSDNQFGQNWVMNDCLLRNREQRNEWVLFVDLDEIVMLPGVRGGLRALAAQLEEQKFEAANFHSVGYLSEVCDTDETEPAAGAGAGARGRRRLSQRMVMRSLYPENCRDVWQKDCTFENRLAMGGRRKVFVKADAANTMAIHSVGGMPTEARAAHLLTRPGVREGDFKRKLRALNASRAWIKHVRGAPFDAIEAPAELRVLCGGPPEGCEEVPQGLMCSDFVPETNTINPQKLWVNELPYVIRARAMGDALAGSYETEMDS